VCWVCCVGCVWWWGGIVVVEEDRSGNKIELSTTYLPRMNDAKLVILVNEGSASSSEIFAGAVQDRKSGVLIGEKTFGKGSVQNLEQLKDGSHVKITVAKWLTPNLRQIDEVGIEPDVVVEMPSEDIGGENDVQLKRAIEEVNK